MAVAGRWLLEAKDRANEIAEVRKALEAVEPTGVILPEGFRWLGHVCALADSADSGRIAALLSHCSARSVE